MAKISGIGSGRSEDALTYLREMLDPEQGVKVDGVLVVAFARDGEERGMIQHRRFGDVTASEVCWAAAILQRDAVMPCSGCDECEPKPPKEDDDT